MTQATRKFLCAFGLLSFWLQGDLGGFAAEASASKGINAAQPESRATNNVRSIALPHFEPDLPAAPGRDEYLAVCVSCHSPRYVMMQPQFPQRQWEETVDKMAKVYGAQMDQEQRAAIVRYLVATHGPNSMPEETAAPDEDSAFAPAPKPVARPETFPLLKPPPDSTALAKEVERGAALFAQDCAACHGRAGRGDGFVSQVLLRKPKDLAASRLSLRLLSQVLWDGTPGTAMPSWRSLPPQDLSAVAAYVRSLHQPDQAGAAPPKALDRGNQVYVQNCAPCHGAAGDGKGAAAAALLPQPANFNLKQPDFDYVLRVLTDGIPGTAMPAWKDQISEGDRRALAGFVRSLFEPELDK